MSLHCLGSPNLLKHQALGIRILATVVLPSELENADMCVYENVINMYQNIASDSPHNVVTMDQVQSHFPSQITEM
jgi:hypothetical protein